MYCKNRINLIEELDDYEFHREEDHHYNHLIDGSSSTLVIHPYDPTTIFLSEIYKGKGYSVIDDPFAENETIAELITDHQRILALGHGFGAGLFGGGEMMINHSLVPLLRDKELVFIWCNADQFMKEHQLNGIYSGMFISEIREANMYKIKATQEQITASNDLFATLLGEHLDSDGDVLAQLKREYHIKDNPITIFNGNQIYST